MALPLANTFEGGSDGVTISTANSGGTSGDAFTTVTGAPTFTTAQSMHGTVAMSVVTDGASAKSVTWGNTVVPASSHVYGRMYVRLSSVAPSANTRLMQFLNAGTQACGIRLTTAGNFSCEGATTGNTGGGTTVAASANTWYRIEWDFVIGTGTSAQLNATVYLGDSTTAFGTLAFLNTFTNTFTTVDGVRFGNPAGFPAAMTIWMDDIQVNDTGVPGPSGGGGGPDNTTQPGMPGEFDPHLVARGWF